MISYILVSLQFFLIFLMSLFLGLPSENIFPALSVMSLGLFVGVLALLQNRLGNFNIRPDIKVDGELVTSGIYAYIRHPMYTSVLLIMAGFVVLYPIKIEMILYAVLLVVLLSKLFYEESLWHKESEEYYHYTKTTKRIIPFIF